MKTKKITILHSNDIHGDFLGELKGEKGNLLGGLALLSGYINKVRSEEENVLYVISGDMIQGSLIDAEYKGISTMQIMNYLAPDVVALGNHEFDYGLPHLLFLEKMANFPIVNANLYIKNYLNDIDVSAHSVSNKNLDIDIPEAEQIKKFIQEHATNDIGIITTHSSENKMKNALESVGLKLKPVSLENEVGERIAKSAGSSHQIIAEILKESLLSLVRFQKMLEEVKISRISLN